MRAPDESRPTPPRAASGGGPQIIETRSPWLVLLVLCMGFFMILLDTTIVNVAIPSIIDALKASLDQILWILNAYLLVYAVLLITAGRLGDYYGQRNLFALGLVLFTASSALCGWAASPDQLIWFRAIQGVGGALLTPQTLAILSSIFPPERRGAAFGIWGAVAGVAAVAGPTLGGFLVTNFSWNSIFYVNVPIGILALILTFVIIPDIRPGRRHRLDLVGILLASIGLFLVVFGLIEGQHYDWGVVWWVVNIYEIIAAGVIVFMLFIVWEGFQAEPLIPLSLFANRNFALMNWVTAALAFGMLGLFLPITIYLQSVLGLTALQAGLTMAPMPLTSMFVAPWAGRLADRIGGKYILMTGLAAFALGMGLVGHAAGPNSTWHDFVLPLIVAGFGMGCTFAPMTTVAMRNIEPRMAGAASGVFNTTRQVGGAVGSSVVGAVLQSQLATHLRDQAVARSAGLPEPFRGRFIDAFSNFAGKGLEVGRGQTGGTFSGANLPPQIAHRLADLGHQVFTYGYLDALQPTLIVPVIALAIGSASCLLIQRRARAAEAAARSEERAAAPAAGG